MKTNQHIVPKKNNGKYSDKDNGTRLSIANSFNNTKTGLSIGLPIPRFLGCGLSFCDQRPTDEGEEEGIVYV